MKRNTVVKAVALTMGAAMSMGVLSAFAGCGKKKDALVLMSDELNELFNPFYSTAGSDMEIVGMTQIGMFTTDESGNISVGKNKKGQEEACVALDYEVKPAEDGSKTDYYFVLRNGIKFSDGTPLTMNDVLFNYYVYLDPAYAGSSTMYSTDIVGLQAYRTQSLATTEGQDDEISAAAAAMAWDRLNELVQAYYEIGKTSQDGVYSAKEDKMRSELESYSVTLGYMKAAGFIDKDAENRSEGDIKGAQEQLVKDYNNAIEKFTEELKNDYKGAKDAYTDKSTPYPKAPIYNSLNKKVRTGFDEVISFMYMEGFVDIEYGKKDGIVDKNTIVKATLQYDNTKVKDEESARQYVYDAYVASKFDQIVSMWGTSSQLTNEFTAKAKDVLLHDKLEDDGSLRYKNIEGIKSLGHYTDPITGQKQSEITVNGTDYKIATEHKPDGTPAQEGTYDVLRVTINKVDPKAIWNFGLTIAPYHYYSDPTQEDLKVDIEKDQFGVRWADFEFQTSVIQGKNKYGVSKNRVPLGAGAYVATSKNNDEIDKVGSSDFINNNIVYYKANENFFIGVPKIKKLQYRVVSASNAIGALESGLVDFVSPQFTTENGNYVNSNKFTRKGLRSVDSWQLGYGYIGINATYVPNRYLRYAIMAAMDTERALSYYAQDTAVNIYWGMSAVSWAYPRTDGNLDAGVVESTMKRNNGHDYAMTLRWKDDQRKELIKSYMRDANVSEGDSALQLKFTIAGSSMTEHPCYQVFLKAMQLLNECGWDVEIQADTNALTKLSTGTLAVWAAAWGSGLDPDMYQVWHKKSTATSTLAWGYNSILGDRNKYSYENGIIDQLSDIIDQARTMTAREDRAPLYEKALGLILDLGVELPVYQRKTLYAFSIKAIKDESLAHNDDGTYLINPYSSPLNRIWDIELVGQEEEA